VGSGSNRRAVGRGAHASARRPPACCARSSRLARGPGPYNFRRRLPACATTVKTEVPPRCAKPWRAPYQAGGAACCALALRRLASTCAHILPTLTLGAIEGTVLLCRTERVPLRSTVAAEMAHAIATACASLIGLY
jgi:hypothetical protein